MTEPTQQKEQQTRSVEQRAAQARIEHLEHEGGPFVAAVEATRMPMLVTDPNVAHNPIIFVNAAFLEMCRYEREEVLGRNYHFLGGENTDPEVAAKIDAALSARQNISIEVQFYTKDGKAIWVVQHVSPVTDDQGRIVQHFASFIDITERKQSEDELQRMADSLERRVQARTKKLEEANKRLEEEIVRRSAMEVVLRAALEEKQALVREKEFMMKEVNHRIKNTLQAAQFLLTIQREREDNDRVRDALQDASQRLARLAEIHELLYQVESYQSIDVHHYLETLCRRLLTSLRQDPDRVSLNVHAEDVTWGPDLVLPLALIVNEAVSNALKYAFPQGRHGTINVELRGISRNMYLLVIRDDGIGMPAKRRENSLGLKLVDLFAEQIGGKAHVTNGEGTVVTVAFPA